MCVPACSSLFCSHFSHPTTCHAFFLHLFIWCERLAASRQYPASAAALLWLVSVCLCVFHCLWGHEIAPEPEGPRWCCPCTDTQSSPPLRHLAPPLTPTAPRGSATDWRTCDSAPLVHSPPPTLLCSHVDLYPEWRAICPSIYPIPVRC